MKKILLIILVLISIKLQSQTYQYNAFPEDSSRWIVLSGYQGPFGWVDLGNYAYTMIGDTIINSKIYSKIYDICTNQSYYETSSGYNGCIREDSLKKIYYIQSGTTNELLFYDFSLSVGDTFNLVVPYSMGNFLVTSIDTILYFNKYRKVFNLTTLMWGENQTIVEGIGNVCGLFEILETGNGGSALVCFREKYNYQYGDTGARCDCNFNPNSNSEILNEREIKVFPSKFSSFINIQFVDLISENNQNIKIEIVDLMGKHNKQIEIENKNLISINLSDLKRGVYFMKIIKSNYIKIFKIIKE